ncbi:MAG: hypothetical protein DRQ47_06235, partial [Gammaproteobacteria bacterium]
MIDEEHSLLVSAASLLAIAIEHYGLDHRDIAEAVGIDLSQPLRPHDRIPLIKVLNAWTLAVEQTGDSCFGLTAGSLIQATTLSGLGYSWLASATLKEGILRLVRYQRMISTDLDIQLEEKAESYCIHFNSWLEQRLSVQASVDSVLSAVVQVCRIMIGNDFVPESVSFQHPLPSGKDSYQRFHRFFAAPVNF